MLNISLFGLWGKGGGPVYIFIVALFAEAKVKPGEERAWSGSELGMGRITAFIILLSVKRR